MGLCKVYVTECSLCVCVGIVVWMYYIPIHQFDMASKTCIHWLSLSVTCAFLPRPWWAEVLKLPGEKFGPHHFLQIPSTLWNCYEDLEPFIDSTVPLFHSVCVVFERNVKCCHRHCLIHISCILFLYMMQLWTFTICCTLHVCPVL